MCDVLTTSNKPSLEAIYYEASKEEKEVMFNNLKKEVDKLLGRIKKFKDVEVKRSFFKSIDRTKVEIYSNGKICLGEPYYDPIQTYIRTRMKPATLEDIPERHRFNILKMQKDLFSEVLSNLPEKHSETAK
jgi:hypothetical protein